MRHSVAQWMLLGVCAAGPVSAGTLSFAFSFDNSAQGGGPVGVVIRGLTDDATSSASSVSVTVNDGGGYGLGEYVSATSGPWNTFTLADGQIIGFSFKSLGINNTLPAVICCSLAFSNQNPAGTFIAGLSNQPNDFDPGQLDDIVFVPLDGDALPIPLPAALPLLASAVAALGLGLKALRRS